MQMFNSLRKKIRDMTPSTSQLEFWADYAGDGVDGGTPEQVLNALREEIALADRFGFNLNFSKMRLYTAAGANFVGDLSGFEELGIPKPALTVHLVSYVTNHPNWRSIFQEALGNRLHLSNRNIEVNHGWAAGYVL